MHIVLKKTFYLSAFIFLGILLSTLLHALIEIPILSLITAEEGSLRLSWETWKIIHDVGGIILFITGIIFGVWQGLYWWPKLYDETGKVRGRNNKYR